MQVRGRPIHFGVQLQGQGTSWSDYAAAVRFVEDLGYGSVWIFDHLLAPFKSAEDRSCFETLTTLGAVSLLTTRARVGVLVNGVLYRDPAVLAKASAQVDEMTGGRLEFSLGAAWAEREFEVYGIPFPSLEERYQRLEEALQIVKALWSQPRTTFHGRYYHLDDAPCEPKPAQTPHPPITVGGSGAGSLRVAARHADRLNMQGTPREVRGHNRETADDVQGDRQELRRNRAVPSPRHRSQGPVRRGGGAGRADRGAEARPTCRM